MMDRDKFFKEIEDLFPIMKQSQRAGIAAILDEAEKRQTPTKWLAYILATVYHETGTKMQPVKEFGSQDYLQSKKYYPYYGRDLVQTTWLTNYKKVAQFSGINVVDNPDLIGELNLAVKVAFEFMEKGYYTGKKLGDYFSQDKNNPLGARRIINGQDKAQKIAGYYRTFHSALI